MTPIAVFAYTRPCHLKLCLEAIQRAEAFCQKKFPLFIFCDFPRKEEDVERAKATQKIAQEHPGACVIVREKNYGFRNITEGISQLCNEFGKAIIIEDDVLVAPDFLFFMEEAMARYEGDERVFMISGFMYASLPQQPTTFFLRSAFIWGWATFARAWRHFEWHPVGWQELLQNKKERDLFDFFGAFLFSKNLEKTLTGKWNTWDAQWMYALFQKGGLALYPSRSLVWNMGVGGGTHGKKALDENPLLGEKENYIHGAKEMKDFEKPQLPHFSFPQEVEVNKKSMRHLALIFLQERKRKNPKKRVFFKILKQKLLLPFTR